MTTENEINQDEPTASHELGANGGMNQDEPTASHALGANGGMMDKDHAPEVAIRGEVDMAEPSGCLSCNPTEVAKYLQANGIDHAYPVSTPIVHNL